MTYDRTAPTETVRVLGMTRDSGIAGDWITNDGAAGRTVTGSLSIALAADEALQLSFNGGGSWVNAAVGGTGWSAVDPLAHAASWSIQARVVDLAGNAGPLAAQAVTYDVTPPTKTVRIASMTKDSGTAGDFLTNDGSAGRTVSGTLSSGLATGESCSSPSTVGRPGPRSPRWEPAGRCRTPRPMPPAGPSRRASWMPPETVVRSRPSS
ncbi:hypothetical protein ACFQY5_03710 [Paeniroseomonas aquatica]|uniref:hypothetical protein n=1 Tax=Paeniroseomonas aquatica TaxID=373043 RepID=UPI00362015D2